MSPLPLPTLPLPDILLQAAGSARDNLSLIFSQSSSSAYRPISYHPRISNESALFFHILLLFFQSFPHSKMRFPHNTAFLHPVDLILPERPVYGRSPQTTPSSIPDLPSDSEAFPPGLLKALHIHMPVLPEYFCRSNSRSLLDSSETVFSALL